MPPVGWGWERKQWAAGHVRVAGVDEAGRGPIAGPVVAAAVILPPGCEIPGLNDSKQLSAAQREALYPRILEAAETWGVAFETAEEIDRINILRASLRAMADAVGRLQPSADCLLIDGNRTLPQSPIRQEALVKGDAQSVSIAAASVLAKVVRDRVMVEFDRAYPGYGFARHKGYGTRAHLAALGRLGPSPIHRRSFRPVRDILEDLGKPSGAHRVVLASPPVSTPPSGSR